VLNVTTPTIDLLDLVFVDIQPHDFGAGTRKLDCERQPHITQSNDTDFHNSKEP